MADPIDHSNMDDAVFLANIFSVKEEQCQEDNFVEDKVYISETSITTHSNEFQGPVLHGKIKHQEESTSSDNIKTELEVAKVQNDIVKIERGINADDIKIEIDDGLLYCENCEAYYESYCIECGMLVHILNNNILNSADKRARDDIPNDILEIQDCVGQTGIYAIRIIPAGVKFGPFTGLGTTECPWTMKGDTFVLDKNKSKHMNWMKYVNPTRNTSQQNLHVIKSDDNIYYQSTRQIQAGEELLVYFGEEYGNSLNKIIKLDFITTTKDISKIIFACTFCCLGFSSKSHLAKHKTVCVKDAAGRFSIEELTRCPFCNVHLDRQEYFEHHMAFCCERNARKGILPTPPGKQAATALNRRTRCLLPIYRCEQCKYWTKYQADLIEHTNNQHYEVKIYKCWICDRRFKTKESLRLHVQNTHAYIGGKNGQENYTTGYRNTLIKVGQSSSHDQKKIFKCLLCVFRAKYKRSMRTHIKSKHLKEFDFKCDACEYKTNIKTRLKTHVKSKHLKKFDFKCDSCGHGTNKKSHLEAHIKTKHLKEFDFKCDSCEYGTNFKSNFEVHTKRKHLKELYFKCDLCEYRTNIKNNLELHIKSTHASLTGLLI